MNPRDLVRLEAEMGVLVRRLRRVMAERARLLHPEMSASEYSVCAYLHREGPQRAATLVEAFETDKGAMSRHIAHLEELGLVSREPDPSDGRAQLVSLTAGAVARHDEVTLARRERLAAMLDDWEPGDLERFIDDLSRYNDTLEGRHRSRT